MSTFHRASIVITKEDYRQLEELMAYFEENRSQVIKRALHDLYHKCSQRKDFIKFINEEK